MRSHTRTTAIAVNGRLEQIASEGKFIRGDPREEKKDLPNPPRKITQKSPLMKGPKNS